ncbi:hypothetical protein [Ruminococcus flavefaciens]|uniref:hypothetical protein n=1 Tax=Ruminococcus flavefaciens TaxID=1265 RepID=UPI0026F1B2DC|nr:hypothetical protein [Ruminococcus flavefaciens]
MRVKALPYEEACLYKLKIDKVNSGFNELHITQRELTHLANESITDYRYDEPTVSLVLTGQRTMTRKNAVLIDFALDLIKQRKEYWDKVRSDVKSDVDSALLNNK